jgi:Putative lumazine-binding
MVACKPLLAGFCAPALALALGACGEAVSTGSFKGESHSVAQTLSDFQKDATAGAEAKLCQRDLAAKLAGGLRGRGGCQAALKSQLKQVDALNLTVESIAVDGTTARAHVKSTWSGRNRVTTLFLVREGTRWKISGASG